MKSLFVLTGVVLLSIGSVARAADKAVAADSLAGYEAVDSFVAFNGPYSFTALDDRTLIVWATPFKPYLVELRFPARDLKWAQAVGVTQFGSRVHAGFDSVQVRGFRYPIDGIYKLSREQARELKRSMKS